MSRVLLRKGPSVPATLRISALRSASTSQYASHTVAQSIRSASSSAIPIIIRPSFWKSLVPKPFRRDANAPAAAGKRSRSREPNPATFFIVIFLFIGSMAIQMITLKKEFETFVRQSDTRIGLLREVIEKVQRGEKVDVERVLGTGDPEKELEWEEVLKEIERDEAARNQKKKQQPESTSPASPKSVATQAVPTTPPPPTTSSSQTSFF